VTRLTSASVISTRPALPGPAISLPRPVDIRARVKVSEKIVTRTFPDVPVEPVGATAPYRFTPDKVELAVRGPLNTATEMAAGRGIKIRISLEGLGPGVFRRRPSAIVPNNMEVLVGQAGYGGRRDIRGVQSTQ
jgi:hypothetical protein